MSAWNPSVFGRSTISSSSTMCFQLCMPPQQISPSAASRSPCSSAMEQASRKVSAMRFVLSVGILGPVGRACCRIDAHDAILRMPRSRSLLADGAGFADLGEKTSAILIGSHGGAAAGGRPHRSDQRADDKAARSRYFPQTLQIDRRWNRYRYAAAKRNRSTPSNLHSIDLGRRRSDRAWCRDRWAARNPVLCRPVPATWHCGSWEICASYGAHCYPLLAVLA